MRTTSLTCLSEQERAMTAGISQKKWWTTLGLHRERLNDPCRLHCQFPTWANEQTEVQKEIICLISHNTLTTWCGEGRLKRPWCWERLKVGGEGDDRGWGGWMTSPTQFTRVWVNSGSWWWTGRPGVLQSIGSQRVGHDWATELNWPHICHKHILQIRLLESVNRLCLYSAHSKYMFKFNMLKYASLNKPTKG